MEELNKNEYASYFQGYIDLAIEKNHDFHQSLLLSLKDSINFFNTIPVDKHLFRYADNKWTIKEILQHIIDTERILSYRALRFSRGDKTNIPGYDDNKYAENSFANYRDFENLINEFIEVRKSTIYLFKSFQSETLKNIGIAGDNNVSVRALGYIISGHLLHHIRIIEQLYLQ
ncbi:MAG: DinB family protein [Bacteroidota bacterium]